MPLKNPQQILICHIFYSFDFVHIRAMIPAGWELGCLRAVWFGGNLYTFFCDSLGVTVFYRQRTFSMKQALPALHSKQLVSRCPTQTKWLTTASLVGLLAWAAPAMADDGSVLPSSAQPLGYSLAQLAEATAVYNTGASTGNPATPAPPDIPFEVLVGNTTVAPDTYIYVPIFFEDNTPPVAANFPTDIADQAADAAFLDAVLAAGMTGPPPVSALVLQVDSQTTILDDSYITGVTTPPLLDGSPGGTEYIVAAAVVSPLSPGDHTIGIGGVVSGTPTIFFSDSVSVVPEPGAVGMFVVAGGALIRRRRRARASLRQ